MKILYQDLLNFLSEKPSIDLLSERLYQLEHEHEINGDIFEMELTPNRGDCLSLTGLARDLSIFFGNSEPVKFFDDEIDSLDIKFSNNSPFDCPKISFLEIEIDNINTEYQSYLENYFQFIGGNKVNFFTDISNYISYEIGQPTHCFDSESLNGNIIFDKKSCYGSFTTLFGSKIELEGKNCVFTIDDEIISLAGVIGGSSTACSSKTSKVLVECAYFEPESIIGKSIKYNLNSDAAYKFERGVDIGCHELALRRFIKVVSDHANIKTLKLKTFDYKSLKKNYLSKDFNKINKILGTNIDELEIMRILTKLGFVIEDKKILVPTHRHDIYSQNDLAEEIARVIGYNNIKSSPIFLPKTEQRNIIDKVKYIGSYLTTNGFTETINFPFNEKTDKPALMIDNPLDSNKSFMRTSLKSSLVKNFIYNQRRQKQSIKLFEISDIYYKNSQPLYKKKLGLIAGGRQGYNYEDFSKKLSLEYLQNILNDNFSIDFFEIIEIPYHLLDTKIKDKVFYVEVFIDDIPDQFFELNVDINQSINFIKYMPVSEFPSSARDLSFSISDPKNLKEVVYMLENIEDNIVSKSFIFDFYKNKKQETIKLGNRIIFQSKYKTLSEDDINKKLAELIKPILELDGVFIEGM